MSFVDAALITIGDIVKLEQGDLVPADIRVLECSPNMCVDNSSLTGRVGSDQAQAGVHERRSVRNGQPLLLRRRQDRGQHRSPRFDRADCLHFICRRFSS